MGCVDLICPWSIKINGTDLEFLALTAIDPVMTLSEIICIDNKSSAHVAVKISSISSGKLFPLFL
jgi:hypothetical protein